MFLTSTKTNFDLLLFNLNQTDLFRLITMVVYLSDVLEGGNTVFPKLDIAVAPRKGSAVVWENLRSDGTPYEETLHAGCPVLIGSKKVYFSFALQSLN